MSNFCKLHGNTDAPCPECRLLDDELVAELRHERDEAHRCLAIAEEALTRMADVERDSDRLRALLREVEWTGDRGLCCPVCQRYKNSGRHNADCKLAAALEQTGGTDD